MVPLTQIELILVRHAVAFERDGDRWPDDALRPLTPAGRKKFSAVAKGIRRILPRVDVVLSSSLVRAVETAEILRKDARWPKAQICDALKPSHSTAEVFKAVRELSGRIALVGHEPQIARLLSAAIGHGPGDVRNDFRKGGIALIEFEGKIDAGHGQLLWFASPSLVRTLRRKQCKTDEKKR